MSGPAFKCFQRKRKGERKKKNKLVFLNNEVHYRRTSHVGDGESLKVLVNAINSEYYHNEDLKIIFLTRSYPRLVVIIVNTAVVRVIVVMRINICLLFIISS